LIERPRKWLRERPRQWPRGTRLADRWPAMVDVGMLVVSVLAVGATLRWLWRRARVGVLIGATIRFLAVHGLLAGRVECVSRLFVASAVSIINLAGLIGLVHTAIVIQCAWLAWSLGRHPSGLAHPLLLGRLRPEWQGPALVLVVAIGVLAAGRRTHLMASNRRPAASAKAAAAPAHPDLEQSRWTPLRTLMRRGLYWTLVCLARLCRASVSWACFVAPLALLLVELRNPSTPPLLGTSTMQLVTNTHARVVNSLRDEFPELASMKWPSLTWANMSEIMRWRGPV